MSIGCFEAEWLLGHQVNVKAVFITDLDVKVIVKARFQVVEDVVAAGVQFYNAAKLGAIDGSCQRAVETVHQVQVALTGSGHVCVGFLI